MANCCIKEAKQREMLGHPPRKSEQEVRVPLLFTLCMVALAAAYRLPCGREAIEGGPVGWRLVGVKTKDGPPDTGGRQQVLAKEKLPDRR
jgi:hypothetical protein